MEETPLNARSNIQEVVATVSSGNVSGDLRDQYLDTLEEFECWAPFFKLVKRCIDDPSIRRPKDYIRLARVQYLYMEDVFSSAETCAHLVNDLNIGYQGIVRDVLPYLCESEDYTTEATILQGVYPTLKSKADQVACLERLCLIYEKRKYDERLLNLHYEKLITIDPNNVKALRYFKVLFTQNNEWEEVISILNKLYAASKHRNDRFRIAQELATVYLYQLGEARRALEAIETLCEGSPLDTSTIHYEAYYRLKDWAGCLRVVQDSLRRENSPNNQAILYLRIGELQMKLQQFREAKESFERCIVLSSHLLEPFEFLVEIAIQEKNWDAVLKHLDRLSEKVKDPTLLERINEAKVRLLEGVEQKSKPPQAANGSD